MKNERVKQSAGNHLPLTDAEAIELIREIARQRNKIKMLEHAIEELRIKLIEFAGERGKQVNRRKNEKS